MTNKVNAQIAKAAQGSASEQQATNAVAGAGSADIDALEVSVLYNCCTNHEAPDWERFDAIEVGGCRNEADQGADDTYICGGYTADEAEFFTVYGHLVEGGVEAITDAPTLERAQAIANIFANQNGFEISIFC